MLTGTEAMPKTGNHLVPVMLSTQEIQEALRDPHSSIKAAMTTYAGMISISRNLVETEESSRFQGRPVPRRSLARAAERLSARGRSKRLLVEPGVTAARITHFSGWLGGVPALVQLLAALQASTRGQFLRSEGEPVRA